ncbi:MAG: flagellar basal body rod protein FlgC [Gemmatimonadaceae bacterium]
MPRPVGLLPSPAAPQAQPMFRSLAIAASGLSAQRVRMETVASNIANAETTHDVNGAPYRRRVAVLAGGDGTSGAGSGPLASGQTAGTSGVFNGVNAFQVPSGDFPADGPRRFQVPVLETNGPVGSGAGVHVAGIQEDTTDGQLVYDPGHPDADKNGYVHYPNVRVTDEIVDMMDARRVYEANASVFQTAKGMLKQALNI